MLVITVPAVDSFDEVKSEFITSPETTIRLEHSLVSLSKWEEEWEKPFLGPGERTYDETVSYIKCMVIGDEIPPEVFSNLSSDNFAEINKYIAAKKSATWFNDQPGKGGGREVITSELVYYWMIALNIPFECQHWHLNRLFTLIKVCNQKNSPAKKMKPEEIADRNRKLNAERRAKFGTSG